MNSIECRREFEYRLFNLLRTYKEYMENTRKLNAFNNNTENYIQTGNLTIPTHKEQQEFAHLTETTHKLQQMLIEQATCLEEPLNGILPITPRFDPTYTPKTIHEILDAVCQFVGAAVKQEFSSCVLEDLDMYEQGVDNY